MPALWDFYLPSVWEFSLPFTALNIVVTRPCRRVGTDFVDDPHVLITYLDSLHYSSYERSSSCPIRIRQAVGHRAGELLHPTDNQT